MQIAVNSCFGGFSLSDKAVQLCAERGLITSTYPGEDVRSNPILIGVIEELRDGADGAFAAIRIVDVPDDVQWQIGECDGQEWVEEKHRQW